MVLTQVPQPCRQPVVLPRGGNPAAFRIGKTSDWVVESDRYLASDGSVDHLAAVRLLRRMNGITRLATDGYQPVALTNEFQNTADSSTVAAFATGHAVGVLHLTATATLSLGGTPVSPTPVTGLAALAKADGDLDIDDTVQLPLRGPARRVPPPISVDQSEPPWARSSRSLLVLPRQATLGVSEPVTPKIRQSRGGRGFATAGRRSCRRRSRNPRCSGYPAVEVDAVVHVVAGAAPKFAGGVVVDHEVHLSTSRVRAIGGCAGAMCGLWRAGGSGCSRCGGGLSRGPVVGDWRDAGMPVGGVFVGEGHASDGGGLGVDLIGSDRGGVGRGLAVGVVGGQAQVEVAGGVAVVQGPVSGEH
jgi:hypothetical protein